MRVVLAVMVGMGSYLGVLPVSSAQSPGPISRAPQAPFVDVDSVRNIVAFLNPTPEATPGTCLAAIDLARTELERDGYRDTLSPVRRSDTLSVPVQKIGTACRQLFTSTNTHAQELKNLVALGIQLDDTVLLHTALAWWVNAPQLQPTDRKETVLETKAKRIIIALRISLRHHATELSLTAPPPAPVQSLVHAINVLGPEAKRWQLESQAIVMLATFDAAERGGPWIPSSILRDIHVLLARTDSAASADRPSPTVLVPLLIHAEKAYVFQFSPRDSVFYDTLRAKSPTIEQLEPMMYSLGIVTMRVEVLLRGLAGALVRHVGSSAPSIAGGFWYNTTGQATWPQSGQVSLLVPIRRYFDENRIGMLRRFAAEYGGRGLHITLAASTQGYWLKSGAQTGPVPSAQEAAYDSAYCLDYLKLPVTLVVQPSSFVRDREHRLVQPAEVQFAAQYGDALVLVDRSGHLLLRDTYLHDEGRLRQYIERALTQK